MAPFKDEWVFIIAPGSRYTNVQLGLPESFTPPQRRFATRMFPGLKPGEWEPIRIETRRKVKTTENKESTLTNGDAAAEDGTTNGEPKAEDAPAPAPTAPTDVEMADAPTQPEASTASAATENGEPTTVTETAETKPVDDQPGPAETEPEVEYEDDPYSEEGAVYPIVEGRIENWSCFFALLSHIWKTMGPHFVSPLLVISQPCWTERDKEMVTQYFFENHRIPAFCMMDAALAACYAYGIPSGLVVDVGFDKCDVSAVTEYQVNDSGRAVALEGCGGRAMTKRLQEAVRKAGIDCDETMAEALKKSSICEILPPGANLPVGGPVSNDPVPNPAAAASTGATESGANAKEADGTRPGAAPRGPGNGTEVGEENGDDDNEGVLDVANIVAQANAAEILAKREAEKAARAAAKKGNPAEAPRPVRLRNSEKVKASFAYEELLPIDAANADGSRKRKREVEVGVERFMAAYPSEGQTDGILDTITAAIHSTVLGVPDITQRSNLWDNLIILGNGSRVRGFTAALTALLSARYTLSPSTATMFTSELPSNFTTPVGTPGTNTPIPGQPGHPMHHPGGHGVNPLLVAATRNVMQPNPGQHQLQVPGHATPMMDPHVHHYRGFSQSPTSIKQVKLPDYFPEWKHPSVSGMEEAAFLGAQVAGKVIFMVDAGQNKGFMSRTEYNDLGPAGIHDYAM